MQQRLFDEATLLESFAAKAESVDPGGELLRYVTESFGADPLDIMVFLACLPDECDPLDIIARMEAARPDADVPLRVWIGRCLLHQTP